MDIHDKVIAVTGSGNGIGRSVAVELAGRGASVAVIDINQAAAEETVGLCAEAGGNASAFCCDVSDEAAVESTFSGIVGEFGRIDGLINNAGIVRDGMLVKVKEGKVVGKKSLANWQSVINVNLTGVFLCGREVAARMIERGSEGVIVNVSSISRAGNFGQSNYTAAKAGVAAMTVTWAKELARYSIRVAAIAPGFIATPMVMAMKPEARARMTDPTPLRRLGMPKEIAQTVNFIFENDFLTGRVIEVDGGLRI